MIHGMIWVARQGRPPLPFEKLLHRIIEEEKRKEENTHLATGAGATTTLWKMTDAITETGEGATIIATTGEAAITIIIIVAMSEMMNATKGKGVTSIVTMSETIGNIAIVIVTTVEERRIEEMNEKNEMEDMTLRKTCLN